MLEELTLDDPKTFELLARGDTLGVFQLDGGPMRALLRSMRPDNFEDISAVGALYRPGPMGANSHNEYADRKNGRKPVVPIHPELAEPLAEILGDTYGLIVYQEQVMAIAQKVAGYSLGQADILRRAMGKKKKAELDAQFEGFAGRHAGERGYSRPPINDAVGHPAAVLRLRVQQGALGGVRAGVVLDGLPQGELPGRVHGRAADLGQGRQGQDGRLPGRVPADGHQGAAAVRELLRRELHPDRHRHPLRPDRGAQRRLERRRIRSSRPAREKGEFADFADFLRKVDAVVCNKRTIEALIKGGAFDSLGHARRGLINVYEPAVDAVLDTKRAEAIGQFDLFGSFGDDSGRPGGDVFAVRVPDGEWDKKVLLQFEREMLGLYVSDHPLFGLEHVLAGAADDTIANVQAEASDEPKSVTLAGILSSVNRRVTKAGAPWANAVLEDLEGSIEVMFFPATYAQVALTIAEDAVVSIKGRTDAREDTVKLIASDISVLNTDVEAARGPVAVAMAADPLHPADGRPAQGRAGGAPRHDRGAPAPDQTANAALLVLGDGSGSSRRPR